MNIADTSSTTLQITWNPPQKDETNGIIREYKVRYRQVGCVKNSTNQMNGTNLMSWKMIIMTGSSSSTELKNLTKWSCYEVQIRAVTVKGGVWSGVKQHRTSEDGMQVYLSFFQTLLDKLQTLQNSVGRIVRVKF